MGKAADAEQAGAGAALHWRGAVGDFDSPGQGRAGQGRAGQGTEFNGESGGRVVAGACSRCWLSSERGHGGEPCGEGIPRWSQSE